jgi:hypothetical protein
VASRQAEAELPTPLAERSYQLGVAAKTGSHRPHPPLHGQAAVTVVEAFELRTTGAQRLPIGQEALGPKLRAAAMRAWRPCSRLAKLDR